MSNQRSVMTEFRFLDQKRQAEGLTAEEASRYALLREQVGPETSGPPRSGFDVNAAAARLRESLLPAGLRARPPGQDAPPPAPAAPPPPAEPPESAALEQAWADAPFADLAGEPAADQLFDPGSLAQEARPQAWNPEAPGYDPDAPYDEAAWIAAGYDPTATYDWSAAGYGPDGQPLEAGGTAALEPAPLAEPSGELLADPSLELVAEPLPDSLVEPDARFDQAEPPAPPAEPAPAEAVELPWDGALPEPGAAPVTGAAATQAWDSAPGLEATWAQAVEGAPAEAPRSDPVAAPLAPDEELPFDPNAPFDHAKWFGRPPEPAADLQSALEPAPAAELEPGLAVEPLPALEPEALLDALTEPPLEPAASPEEPDLTFELAAHAAPDSPPIGALDGGSAPLVEAPLDQVEPPPATASQPFGEYDETSATAPPISAEGFEALLPFDLAAASAIEPGAMPEGYEPGGTPLDPASLPPVELGAYDDPSAYPEGGQFGGPEGDSLPGGTPLELGAALPDWQPDTALEQGFQLASDGSFGLAEGVADRRTPAWGTALPAAPAEAWESPPALDLAGPFEEPSAVATLQPAGPAVEELPTIDGAELLEELPPEGAPTSLDMAEPAPLEPEAAALPAWAEPLHEAEPAVSYHPQPEDPGGDALPPEIAAAYGDAGAAGDTFELPPIVAEGLFETAPPPEPEPIEAEPLPPPAPSVLIEGTHRVVLHTVDGQVKRGLLVDALLDAPALPLRPQVAGTAEDIPAEAIKAIFFMLAPGEKAPAPEGKKVRVTFRDGRQVAGFSPDYQEGLVGFFMIPADTRTNTGRIWVYQAAVKQVAVS